MFWDRTHALREPKESFGTVPVRESGYLGLPIPGALHAKALGRASERGVERK